MISNEIELGVVAGKKEKSPTKQKTKNKKH